MPTRAGAHGQAGTRSWHDMPVTESEFIETVVAACRRLPSAEAVNLGGSRARGDFRPRQRLGLRRLLPKRDRHSTIRGAGPPGRVFRPFEWGQVMYGGAVFDLDGRHFDIHFRNLDVGH